MTISSHVQSGSLGEADSFQNNMNTLPLSPEARGIRASLTTQQELIDVVEDTLHSMEQTDLKKARLYKVALVILTVVGLAIFFVIPVCMLFGVSLWLPVVLTLGVSLFFGFVGNKLRSRYQEIRLKYRSLQVYHAQLSSRYPGLKNSTLSKYHIQMPKTQDSLKTKLLAKLRPDLHSQSFDGGASLDETLGLFGEINSRYRCEAAVGIDDQERDVAWKKCLSQVLKAKVELLKNSSVQNTLTDLANASLQEAGVDLSLLPQANLLDFAQSLIRVCSFGAHFGEETLQCLDQYERLNLHSKTLISWGGEFSSATHMYLSQGRATVDFALNVLSVLQLHVSRLQESLWLSEFTNWKEKICSFLDAPSRSLDYQQLVQEAHKLNTHEGTSEKKQKVIRDILRQLELFMQEPSENQKEEIKNQLDAITSRSIADLGRDRQQGTIQDICGQVQKDFVAYLVSLGDLNLLFDRIHLCMQLGKYVRKDIQNAVAKHPENQRARILHTLDHLAALVNKDTWGAISEKPIEDILKEKQEIQDQLQNIRHHVDEWSTKYEEFKSQKITRILMKEFSENSSSLDAMLDRLQSVRTDTTDTGDFDNFIGECRADLNRNFTELGGQDVLPSTEEITQWSQEYADLVKDLEAVLPDCQLVMSRVRGEGETGGSLLLKALMNKESSLSNKVQVREKELVSAIRHSRQSLQHRDEETLLTQGMANIEDILTKMNAFEESLCNPQNLVVENIIQASNDLFLSIQGQQLETLTELENMLSLRSDGDSAQESVIGHPSESTAQTLHEAQKSAKNFWEKRHRNLDVFLSQVQKSFRKWQLSQALISGVLGIVLLIVSLSLLSLQFVWLPIGIAAIALVLQVVPMLFGRVIDKKALDVSVAELAKEFLPSTKILPSEFGNQDLNRLAELQNVLQLEGYEQRWARETLEDIHRDLSPKSEDFQSTIKQLQKDAKSLNKLMEKRWGRENLSPDSRSCGSSSQKLRVAEGSASSSSSQESEDSTQQQHQPSQNLDAVTAEILSIEAIENQIVCRRLRNDLESTRYQQQLSYRDQLRTHLENQKEELTAIQQELVVHETLSNILSQAFSQSSQSQEQIDSQEVSSIVEQLTALTFSMYDSNSSEEERKSAKSNFDSKMQAIADSGLLLAVGDALELSSCLGKGEIQFDSRRRSALRYLNRATSSGEDISQESPLSGQKEVEVRKTLFKYLGIEYLSPFLDFTNSKLHSKGHSQAEVALAGIKLIHTKLHVGDTVSCEEYKKACRSLSAYLQTHRRLSPLAHGRLLGDQNSMKCAHMMRENHALQEMTRLNLLIGNQNLCVLASQRMEKWLKRLANKRENRHLFANVLEGVRIYETASSSEKEKIKEMCAYLSQVPPHLLRYMQRKHKSQALILTEKLQQAQEMHQRMLFVSQKVEEKNSMRTQEAFNEEMEKLNHSLRQLQERKAELHSQIESSGN